MRKFESPRMNVVLLSNENIIYASDQCPTHNICSDPFYCDDCSECTGTYACLEFVCYEKYHNQNS